MRGGLRVSHPVSETGSRWFESSPRSTVNSPILRTTRKRSQRFRHLPVAQRTEWMATNHQVAGSTPAGETNVMSQDIGDSRTDVLSVRLLLCVGWRVGPLGAPVGW